MGMVHVKRKRPEANKDDEQGQALFKPTQRTGTLQVLNWNFGMRK